MRALALGAGAAAIAFSVMVHAETAPSIEAMLTANTGKAVTLRLEDGGELSGTLASTSPVTVKLTNLTGKEFYEAVIRKDRIAAVVVRSPGK